MHSGKPTRGAPLQAALGEEEAFRQLWHARYRAVGTAATADGPSLGGAACTPAFPQRCGRRASCGENEDETFPPSSHMRSTAVPQPAAHRAHC